MGSRFRDFYDIWIRDLFQLFLHLVKKRDMPHVRHRREVEDNRIYMCIHEWGGYQGKRLKKIKSITPFEVGLDYQLDRIDKYRGEIPLNLTITMSNPELYGDLDKLASKCDNLIFVPNEGMDFAGYSAFYDTIRKKKNAYVILSNSSINKESEECLESLIDYFKTNDDIGLLGISSSSKYYHTLVRNNFNPHIQSFFLLTTIKVLNELVASNGGVFPGVGETNKHLLIRRGEVHLSKLVMGLGYKLAVVNERGAFKFDLDSYPFEEGDYRLYTSHPNKLVKVEGYPRNINENNNCVY